MAGVNDTESFSYQFVLFINSSNITSVPERLSLCITVLQIIKEAQQQHGLRHGDFQRYRYIFYFRKNNNTSWCFCGCMMTWTYKPWIGQLPSRATELLWTQVCEMGDYLLDLIIWAHPPFFIFVINKNRRAPAVKYDHAASSGGLWPLSHQQLHQQLGADKEMHILDKSFTLTMLIWWEQLYLGGVFGHV